MIWDGPVAADPFDNLKSLYVRGCNKLVNIVPSCILGRLKSLESLSVEFCSSLKVVFEPQPLNSLDGHVIACSPLKNFSLGELPQLKCVWDNELHHQVIFQCLRNVNIWSCKSLTSLFPASMAKDLMHLEELKINDCGIVELIEKEGQVPKFVFPKLTSLKLKHLSELKCIYKGIHALRWLALKTLKVRGCNKVEILASQPEDEMPFHKQSLFLVEKGAFPNLQELKLDLSGQMEIWHGHFHDEELFCELRVLKLYHLSMESAISTCRFVQSLTNLENLVVCESYLKELNINAEVIEGLIHELKVIVPFSRYFQNLRTLVMSHCDGLSLKVILPISRYFEHLETLNVSHWDGLSNMFTPAIAKNLVKLTKLTISNCKMLIEVICDEGGKKGHVVAFNQLKYMELDGLTRLRCFGSGGYILKFPSLEDVIVTRCPSMKFFSEGPIEAPKLERVHLSTAVWLWKGNLNITIEEMATVAGVEFMWLSEFPELIGKWHSELNPIKSSWQLKSLVVDKCPSFINIIPSRLMLVLDNLERLLVIDCDSLEEIFDLEGLDDVESTRVLPNLRSINLVNLPKLSQLGNKNTQGALRFNGLGQLTLYNCGNLRHAFTPSMARFLANIRWIKINECAQMEGLIAEEEGQGSAMEKITFSRLLRMELECLPHLTSFLSGKNHVLECPKLTSLTIAHCPQMRSLTWQSLMEIDHDTTSLFTPRELRVTHCDKLKMLSFVAPMSKWTQNDDQHEFSFERV
ncbi:putative disease resistance protein At4g19050 [Eucalyptus grandis]|uniref:putative disease resistance protein At4g19050 n=1 Tax=Eucalyptus grandis TaxID=71139 RepID=UPI00192E7D92|nr:putative disease resistance protein At4g19050 [Eucalyptus grandis]